MSLAETDNAPGYKLHDLRCFDQVVQQGSFQAAARTLNRSHPSIHAAVGRLEAAVGVALLDRSGYRVVPTAAGRSFHEQAATALAQLTRLSVHARQLAQGDEPILRVVLGDLCPQPMVLDLLSAFFAAQRTTRLHLDYEAVGGPAERLRDGSCDLVFHRAEQHDASVEQIGLGHIALVPVAAPGFLPPDLVEATPEQLRPFTQCVIRDTAQGRAGEDHFLIEGNHRCTVADNAMRRDLILRGMAWGHLPDFLIHDDLRRKRLRRIDSRHLPEKTVTIAAVRRLDRPHGPVAERLWRRIGEVAHQNRLHKA